MARRQSPAAAPEAAAAHTATQLSRTLSPAAACRCKLPYTTRHVDRWPRSALLEAPRLLGNVGRAHGERHLRETGRATALTKRAGGCGTATIPGHAAYRARPGPLAPARFGPHRRMRCAPVQAHARTRANAASADGESAEGVDARPLRSSREARAGWPHPAITTRAGQWSRRLPRGRGGSRSRGRMLCVVRRLRGPACARVRRVLCGGPGEQSSPKAATWLVVRRGRTKSMHSGRSPGAYFKRDSSAASSCLPPPAGLNAATSAPGPSSLLPHLRKDWAHCCHICTGTVLTRATSAPGLVSLKQRPCGVGPSRERAAVEWSRCMPMMYACQGAHPGARDGGAGLRAVPMLSCGRDVRECMLASTARFVSIGGLVAAKRAVS